MTPANATFTLVGTFPVAPFTYTVCGFFVFNCVHQAGTAQRLDVVSEWPMQRFAYRKLTSSESLVGNFTVDTGTTEEGGGIRWFELRRTNGAWSLFQEGTYDPDDGHDRFMGSIAMDSAGDIGLGYSVSSSTLNPAIRYATRVPVDPVGTLQAEQTLQAGAGSQTGSNRWGDYSAITVDPADDCTFWYTNQYYTASSATTWATRIGTFKEPRCGAPRSISVADVTLDEADSGQQLATLTVTATPATGAEVIFDYATTGATATAANDFTQTSGSATIATGADSATIQVPVLNDQLDEADETFTVGLSNIGGSNTIGDAAATVMIADNDAPPSVSIGDATIAEGNAGTTNAVFDVTLSAPSGQAVGVSYATADGTATAPADYAATSGTASIAAGATSTTVAVPVAGDVADEANESFTIALSAPSGATVGDGSGTGTIVDDDAPPPDRTPPQTVITSKPKPNVTKKRSARKVTARFAFRADEPATFTCKLDAGRFRACRSPARFRVGAGRHRFRVFATDAAGNADASPASYRWRVVNKKRPRAAFASLSLLPWPSER